MGSAFSRVKAPSVHDPSLDTGEVVITDANGNENTLDVSSAGGWSDRELTNIDLPGGGVTVTVRASGSGNLTVDGLSLVQQSE